MGLPGQFSVTKNHQRSDVAQDSLKNAAIELAGVLMCQNHTQPVLSQFRKHVCENLGGEAVEFVDVQKEWLAFGFGDVFAAVSGIGQTADDQSTQDICNVGTQSSLRKVDDEHLPVLSDKTKKSLIVQICRIL